MPYTDSHFGVQRVKIVIWYGALHWKKEKEKSCKKEFSVQAPIHWLCRVYPCCVRRYGVQNTCKVMKGKTQGKGRDNT